jgi:membrane protein DedA with SNARE-associated domain
MARVVRIQPAHIERAERQFHRWGAGLVLAGRVIPGIRTLVSIPAGLARMDFLIFLATTFVGAYIWCTLLIGAGYLLGHEWPMISSYIKQGFPFLVATGMLAMAIYLLLTRRALFLVWAKIRNTD